MSTQGITISGFIHDVSCPSEQVSRVPHNESSSQDQYSLFFITAVRVRRRDYISRTIAINLKGTPFLYK
jgi:hypothetical protein